MLNLRLPLLSLSVATATENRLEAVEFLHDIVESAATATEFPDRRHHERLLVDNPVREDPSFFLELFAIFDESHDHGCVSCCSRQGAQRRLEVVVPAARRLCIPGSSRPARSSHSIHEIGMTASRATADVPAGTGCRERHGSVACAELSRLRGSCRNPMPIAVFHNFLLRGIGDGF